MRKVLKTGKHNRHIRIAVCLLLCLLFSPASALAADISGVQTELEQALSTDDLSYALPDEARPFVEGLLPADGSTGDLNLGLSNTVQTVSSRLGGLLRESVSGMLVILAVVLLCAVAGPMLEGVDHHAADIVTLASVLAVTAVTAGQASGLMSAGRQAIALMDGFSKSLFPTLAAASAASGIPTAAVARHLATMFFSDTVLSLISRVCRPLVSAYVAAAAAGTALGQEQLVKIAGFLKWAIAGLLTMTLTVFTVYLSLSGALAGSVDALAVKGARLALSGGIPVVGGIVSEAAETVMAGAGLVKNSIGIFGLFGILGICLIPFLRVASQYLLYKLMAAVVTPLANERLSHLLEMLGGAFGLIAGMTGASALLLLISLISIITGAKIL